MQPSGSVLWVRWRRSAPPVRLVVCARLRADALAGRSSSSPIRAMAAIRLAQSSASAGDGLRVSQSARNIVAAGLEEDIACCARKSILPVVPRLKGTVGAGVEAALS